MAASSSGCKTWCIALVSAVIVITADKEPGYVWISVIPIVLFFFLDAYYLGLEQRFRDKYNGFIKKLHTETAAMDDLFIVTPGAGARKTIKATVGAFWSISVWPFYGLLTLMLIVVKALVLTKAGA